MAHDLNLIELLFCKSSLIHMNTSQKTMIVWCMKIMKSSQLDHRRPQTISPKPINIYIYIYICLEAKYMPNSAYDQVPIAQYLLHIAYCLHTEMPSCAPQACAKATPTKRTNSNSNRYPLKQNQIRTSIGVVIIRVRHPAFHPMRVPPNRPFRIQGHSATFTAEHIFYHCHD